MSLDLRTIFFIYTLTNAAGIIVIASLWLSNRKKFNGLDLVIADFIMQFVALILVFQRGYIPDFLSIVFSNFLSLSGSVLILLALEKFFNQKLSIKSNVILILLFLFPQIWFTYYSPNLAVRNLNISIVFGIICIQILYLIFLRLPKSLRQYTKGVSIAFSLYLFVNLSRIIEFFLSHHECKDYFKSGPFELYVILSYNFLFVILTYSLVMMINRRLLAEIAIQEEKYYKVFNESPHAIILTRVADAKIMEVNHGFETLTGYPVKEAIGKTAISLNLWENDQTRYNLYKDLIEKGSLRNIEVPFKTKENKQIYCSLSAEFLSIEGEMFMLTTVEDIDEYKKLLDEQKLSAEELKSINATKDKLLSIIAHDLRGPFANIINLSEILISQIQEKEYDGIESYANMIQNSTQKVTGLLSNLLEWSRLKTGKINFCPAQYNISEVLLETLDLLSAQAIQKEITISYEIDNNLTACVDKNMLSTILRNLVSNSIKFTEKGGNIYIKFIRENKFVECTIMDSGIGMNQTKIDKLFKIDEKVSTPGTHNEQGTGLGLILCKEFVELHQGEIFANSELEKGTIITFTLQA